MCRENNVDVVNFRRAEGRKRHSRIYKCRQHEVIWTNSLIYICPMLKFPASVGELSSGLSQLHTTRRQWCYQPAEIYQHSFSTTKSRIRFRPFTGAMVSRWNRANWTNWTNNPLKIKGGKGGGMGRRWKMGGNSWCTPPPKSKKKQALPKVRQRF